jgi:hypothetical protein
MATFKIVSNVFYRQVFLAVNVEYRWLASSFFYSLFLQQWNCLQITENGGPLISSTKISKLAEKNID